MIPLAHHPPYHLLNTPSPNNTTHPTPHQHTHPTHHHPPTPPLTPPPTPTTHPQKKSGAFLPDISWVPPHSLPIWFSVPVPKIKFDPPPQEKKCFGVHILSPSLNQQIFPEWKISSPPHHHPPHPQRKSEALMPDISWAPSHSLPIR